LIPFQACKSFLIRIDLLVWKNKSNYQKLILFLKQSPVISKEDLLSQIESLKKEISESIPPLTSFLEERLT